ncbi:MAG: Ig-like domain-containing protein [Gammaproteobacteria bacterium]|nr:Ig-like domain-containing protein [Gammaproteobacteria bacterium]
MNRDIRGAVSHMLVFLSLAFSLSAQASWEWVNPRPQGNILADVAYGDGRYVAVGHTGTVLISTDGLGWHLVDTGTSAWLEAVLWSETYGRFIAVGNDGEITYSPDGDTWSPLRWEGAHFLYGIAEGNGVIVAVGDGATILRSTDGGSTWQRVRFDPVRDWLNDVVFAAGQFVAVGSQGIILTSPDGQTWTERPRFQFATGGRPSLEGVAHSGTDYLAVGNGVILRSTDAIQWTVVFENGAEIPKFTDVTWDPEGNHFLVVGGSGTMQTVTAGNPVAVASNTTEGFEAVLVAGDNRIAVGDHGIIMQRNGATWSERTTGPRQQMNGVALNGSAWVAVGDGGRVISSPGTAGLVGNGNPALNAITLSGDRYVAVGNGGAVRFSTNGGTSWSTGTSGVTADLFGITSGMSRLVAVGNGVAIYSDTQGASWQAGTGTGGIRLNAVAPTGNGFVAVGSGGAIFASGDGIGWQPQVSPVAENLHGVAAGNGITVAVGERGTVLTSTGGGWTVRNAGSSSHLYAVAFANGSFIASGRDGTVLSSTGGVNWTPLQVTGNTLRGLARAGDVVVAVGDSGTVLVLDCPCAVDDFVTTGVDTPILIDVLANDSGSNLVLTDDYDSRSGQGGTVTREGNQLRYSPPQGFSGTDSFRYGIAGTDSQGAAGTDVATVTIDVSAARGATGNGGGGGGGSIDALSLLMALLAMRRFRERR